MPNSKEESGFGRLFKKTAFDHLLIKLGDWSRFQQIQWFLLFLAAVPQAWYTYAPAFAAANPKAEQINCFEKPELRGDSFCSAWQNGSCKDVVYDVSYRSIVTDVSVSAMQMFFVCSCILPSLVSLIRFLYFFSLLSSGHLCLPSDGGGKRSRKFRDGIESPMPNTNENLRIFVHSFCF